MSHFDSTNNSTISVTEVALKNVVVLSRERLEQRFYEAQKQDVFQQKLDLMIDGLAKRMDLDAELFSFLCELRDRLR